MCVMIYLLLFGFYGLVEVVEVCICWVYLVMEKLNDFVRFVFVFD